METVLTVLFVIIGMFVISGLFVALVVIHAAYKGRKQAIKKGKLPDYKNPPEPTSRKH